MINDIYENKSGYMIGRFYADVFGYEIEAWYKKDISIEYVEKNIRYLNNLERDFMVSICVALRKYYEDYKKILPDICEDINQDIIKDFDKDPTSILSYIDIGTYRFDQYSMTDENIPVINLRGDCAWSGDEGVTIAAKNNQLLYVGPWHDFNVWNSEKNVMYNYAISDGN